MVGRRVKLDEEAEAVLRQIRKATGQSIYEVLKRGPHALREQAHREGARLPYDVYGELDLGRGGYALAPSTNTRRGVMQALRKKLRR
jgi:hypothetical protein